MIFKNKAASVILLIFILCCALISNGQVRIRLHGQVSDSTATGIPGASIRLIAGKDTLTSSTDTAGRFTFPNLTSTAFTVLVRSIGYQSYSKSYVLKEGAAEQFLPLIKFADESRLLTEVEIKAKMIPVRLMKDTVEFNALAYTVRENDKVEDLLKQLPGVEVDKDGNVSADGKGMTKLRVNGKDFFTNNVKEFIAQLPAGIVDKLQVIDDYGDKANFTGIRKGEPQKMLNLVLKAKRNQGKFANLTGSGGTNDRFAVNANANFWQDTKQIGLNGYATNTNTGAGLSTNATIGLNYRNKVGKTITASGNYSYGYNRTENIQESYIETVNALGTLYNQLNSESASKGKTHNIELNLQGEDKENYFTGGLRGSLTDTRSANLSVARQSGIIRQDLLTESNTNQRAPNVNVDFNFGRKFEKPGRLISGALTGGNTMSDRSDNQYNQIGYYDPETGLPVKDSLRNQLVDTRNNNLNINTVVSFTEPLGMQSDSLAKRYLDISYEFSLNRTKNDLSTALVDMLGDANKVDSLSNIYSSSFIKHQLGINYRYSTDKLHYILGINAQPNLLTGAYEGRIAKIHRAGFNLSPQANVTYSPSLRTSYILFYNGNSVTPNFNQLQPVADTRNLQNVVIGNPDLKAAFNHSLNLNYRHVHTKSGSTLMIGLRANLVQNQVVSNTVLIRDTLNSLKQETRYLNTNGNYSLNNNYMWSMPFEGKKYNLDLKASIGYDHRISFADQQENLSKGLNLNQGISLRMNQKWLMLNTNVNYNYKSNVYSLASSRSNTVQTWFFNLDAKTFLIKSLIAGVSSSKSINQGYSFASANPLLLGGFIEKTFFKSRQASVKLEGNDLLNQGNNLTRTVSGNAITESKNNQVTRYFLLTFNWRLQNFGG
jgi:hypothetical protein